MVKFIHTADTHDDTGKLLALKSFVKKNSIDGLIHTGDWVEAKNIAPEVGQYMSQLPKPSEGFEKRYKNNELTEADKKELEERTMAAMQATILCFEKRYKTQNQIIEDIIKENPGFEVVGVPGNHDNKLIYKFMPAVKFADITNEVSIKGINIKGMINTWEWPAHYEPIKQILEPLGIDYILGHDLSDFKDPETAKYAKEANQKEFARLSAGKSPDLAIMHKEPKDYHMKRITNNAAREYLSKHKNIPVLCSHYHTEYIGRYEDHPFIRVGENTFYVIDMDETTKKIKGIDVYAFVKKKSKRSAQELEKFEHDRMEEQKRAYEMNNQELQKAA